MKKSMDRDKAKPDPIAIIENLKKPSTLIAKKHRRSLQSDSNTYTNINSILLYPWAMKAYIKNWQDSS